jgi:hypothetical protein
MAWRNPDPGPGKPTSGVALTRQHLGENQAKP